MPKKPDWTFPHLPGPLSGLTLEALDRLRALIRRHGMSVGAMPQGEVHGLKLREPIDAFLVVIGAADDAPLIVAPPDELAEDGHYAIALVPGGATALFWSPKIALAGVLACLQAEAVVKTSQLAKSGKDGAN
jgi:hypothetical protein